MSHLHVLQVLCGLRQNHASAGESSIRDQCNALAKTRTHDRRGGFQHLRHTWRATGPYIPNYYHIARLNFSALNTIDQFKLTIEYTCRTFE